MGAVLNRGLLGIVSCVTLLCHRIASSLDKNLLISHSCPCLNYADLCSSPKVPGSLPNTAFGSLQTPFQGHLETPNLGNHGCLTAISFWSCTQFLQSQQSKAMPILPIASLSCLGNLSRSYWYNRCLRKEGKVTQSKVWAEIQLQVQSAAHSKWHHWFLLAMVLLNFHLQHWWRQSRYRNLFLCRHHSPMRNRSLRHCWCCTVLHCSFHKSRPQQPRSGEPAPWVESSTLHNPFKTEPNLSQTTWHSKGCHMQRAKASDLWTCVYLTSPNSTKIQTLSPTNQFHKSKPSWEKQWQLFATYWNTIKYSPWVEKAQTAQAAGLKEITSTVGWCTFKAFKMFHCDLLLATLTAQNAWSGPCTLAACNAAGACTRKAPGTSSRPGQRSWPPGIFQFPKTSMHWGTKICKGFTARGPKMCTASTMREDSKVILHLL